MLYSLVIDGNNIFHAAKEYGITIDYVALRNLLTQHGTIMSAVFITGIDSKADTNQHKFLTWMRHNGFMVRTKELEDDGNSRIINVTPMIITELVLAAYSSECVVFVGGNRDHCYPLSRIREVGRRTVVAGFTNSVSSMLKESVDEFIDLTEHIDEISKSS